MPPLLPHSSQTRSVKNAGRDVRGQLLVLNHRGGLIEWNAKMNQTLRHPIAISNKRQSGIASTQAYDA